MENQDIKSFVTQINQRKADKQLMSDDDMDKVTGGSCIFYHNYDVVGSIYVNNGYQGALFECTDCGDCLFAMKKTSEREYKQVRYAEFMSHFGEQFGD